MPKRFLVATMLIVLPVSAGGQPSSQPACVRPNYIGSATMDADRTIAIELLMTDCKPANGLIIYKPQDPHYSDVLKRLGGLQPGQRKAVPHWPDLGVGTD